MNLRRILILSRRLLRRLISADWVRKPVFWIYSGLFVILLVVTCPGSDDTAVPAQESARVEKRDFSVELVESGELESVSQRLVSAPQAAADQFQVVELAPEGVMVKKGDFLARFDATQLETNKALAEQQLATTLADRDRMLAQQALTVSNMENTLKLTEYSQDQARLRLEAQQYESDARKEQARLQLRQAEIDLERIRTQTLSQGTIHESQRAVQATQIRQRANELKTLRTQIARMELRAPLDGLVVYQEVGSWDNRERLRVGYKARPGEALISIPDLARMQVKLYLNETDRADVRPGQAAIIELDAYPDAVCRGRVREIARIAQSVSGESSLKGFVVYVDVTDGDPRLRPGLSAAVRIELARIPGALVVPVGAVFERDGRAVVFAGRGRRPLPVTLGARNDAYVVVTSGVKPGLSLAWDPPETGIEALGFADEKERSDEANRALLQSFAAFRQRGILYDYSKPPSKSQPPSRAGGMETPGAGRGRDAGALFQRGGFGQGSGPGASSGSFRRNAGASPDTGRLDRRAGSGGRRKETGMRRRGEETDTGRTQAADSAAGPDIPVPAFPAGDPAVGAAPSGGFPGMDFSPGREAPSDSMRAQFRRRFFGSDTSGRPFRGFDRGGPPDSVIQRLRREGRMPSPEQFRRFRESRKENRDEAPETP